MRLRRSDLNSPGIRRLGVRKFRYQDPCGAALVDPDALARIRHLAIPPAWTDVWICPHSNGHIQAVGTDGAGRRQYIYHASWHEQQAASKHQRTLGLALALPQLRQRTSKALRQRALTHERVMSAVLRILDVLSIRVGSEAYAAEHESYGLATIQRSHAHVSGAAIRLHFRGKSGVEHEYQFRDAALARTVSQLLIREDPSLELFAWQDQDQWRDVKSTDINAFIKDACGQDFTAKDFRTWNASVLMAQTLALLWHEAPTRVENVRAIREAYIRVAEYLGNTPAVARQSYVDTRIVDLFQDGVVLPRQVLPSRDAHLPIHEAVESAVLKMLQDPHRGGS